MANIFVGSGVNLTTTQAPGNGFAVVVASGGSITTASSDAISAVGNVDVIVAGDVLASNANAITSGAGGLLRVTITSTGTMQATLSSAILSASALTMNNSGFIGGNITLNGGTADIITNSGTINGAVVLGGGNDIYTHRGGSVHDFVDGGGGADIFNIDSVTPWAPLLRIQAGAGPDVDRLDMTQFASAVWIDLDYSGIEVWTRDDMNLTANPWRTVADLTSIEHVVGGRGWDFLSGDGSDNVFGLSGGVDIMQGDGGSDTLDPGAFTSALWVHLTFAGSKVWTQDLFAVNLNGPVWREMADLVSIENLRGTQGADFFFGDGSSNTFSSSANFLTGIGPDEFFGNGGADTYNAAASSFAIWIDLTFTDVEVWSQRQPGVNLTGFTWHEVADLDGVENLTGSILADFLMGDSAANRIEGGRGADYLFGRGGTDTFVFNLSSTELQTSAFRDRLDDFAPGVDKIGIDGFFPMPALVFNAAPVSGSILPHLLYETDTGILSFDADGTGGGVPIEIAILTGTPVLNPSDFILV